MKKLRSPVVKFDGIDGCGKTTLLNAVYEIYAGRGLNVARVKEFGSEQDSTANSDGALTRIGPTLRSIALSEAYSLDDIERELLWAIISRRTNRMVIPAAQLSSNLVLVDRSNVGNLAYCECFHPELAHNFHWFVHPKEVADLIFFIDTPVAECQRRLEMRGHLDVIEAKGIQFFRRVARNFRSLAESDSRVCALDGTRSVEELAQAALAAIEKVCVIA